MQPDIWFYNLGIRLYNINSIAISIGGFNIFWYGILIALGVTAAYFLACHVAKKTGQDPEHYSDLLFWVVPAGAIGARLYYIAFSATQGLADFFDFRGGGLAFFGILLGGVPAAYYVVKKKALYFPQVLDTAIFGVLIGQIIGRWGNFINREAFGRHTNGLFAMRYRVDQLRWLPAELLDHIITYEGVQYVQVHPTFLYEVFSNTLILVFLLWYYKRKKFEGELISLYFIFHGAFRVVWESLRTDSLMMGPIRVSVLVSIGLIVLGIMGMVLGHLKGKKPEVSTIDPT